MIEIERREIVARAISMNLKRQWDGNKLTPHDCPESWTATGGVMRLDEIAEAALTALQEAGYVIVPREPTEAMLEAGTKDVEEQFNAAVHPVASSVYRAMISVIGEET